MFLHCLTVTKNMYIIINPWLWVTQKNRYPNPRHLHLPGHLIPWINFAMLCFYQTLTEGPGIICFPHPDALQDQEVPAAGCDCKSHFPIKFLLSSEYFPPLHPDISIPSGMTEEHQGNFNKPLFLQLFPENKRISYCKLLNYKSRCISPSECSETRHISIKNPKSKEGELHVY